MSSRDSILDRLRREPLPEVPLPEIAGNWTTYQDPVRQFREVLEAVGGRTIELSRAEELSAALNGIETYQRATRVWSRVPEVPSRGGDWEQVADPHQLETLDFCVVSGEFGVAENAAVWVPHSAIGHRAALVITQHLALVVPIQQIIHNMHEAYARIRWDEVPFGVFISGPSKTADIEQSLVIGAHGARSLTVLLVGTS